MQKLTFERAWDKTIAKGDREHIKTVFSKQVNTLEEGVHLSFLKKAVNYKNELLITVLIHNRMEAELSIDQTVISYEEIGKEIAKAAFIVPCTIQAKTSMPWTFIFPQTSETNEAPVFKISSV